MIGALVVAPVVVLCALSDARAFRRTELTKSAAVIALAVAVGFIAFNPLFKQSQHLDTLGFLAVLPLLWVALHRGPRDTAIASFILAGFSIWGTLSAAGPFARTRSAACVLSPVPEEQSRCAPLGSVRLPNVVARRDPQDCGQFNVVRQPAYVATGPLGPLQPLKGLMSQAPGRASRRRARAPATSSMAFDPVGRSSWRRGNLYRMSGTGTTSTAGNADCAVPCRPSIQAT
jgi:hypothetical protein